MAASGTVTVALNFTPTNGTQQTFAPGVLALSPSQDFYCQNTVSIGTSKTALTLGGVSGSDLGYCLLKNLDPTNYVSLYSDNASATEIARLAPNGGVALIPFGPASTPFLAAHTSACNVQYMIISA